MLILSMFSWWYVAGFREQLNHIKMMFVKVNDQFSIPLLFKTLFQPFRQISVGKVDGALEDKMRAWLDRLVSRMIGVFIRTMVIMVGLVAMVAVAIFSMLRIAVWLITPVAPFIGVVLVTYVGTPWII